MAAPSRLLSELILRAVEALEDRRTRNRRRRPGRGQQFRATWPPAAAELFRINGGLQ
jgi:hypothetical protein